MLDLLSLFPPQWCQQGVSAGPVLGISQACEQDWNQAPALGTWGCPTSPLCQPGAERVTLCPSWPLWVVWLCLLYLCIVSLCLAWQLSTVGWLWGPYRSTASLCRDIWLGWGVHWGPKAITSPPGVGRGRNQPLLTNCLPPAKERNQVFPAKRPFSPAVFCSSAPVLVCVTCPWHWARGSHPHPACPSHPRTPKSGPKMCFSPTWINCCV